MESPKIQSESKQETLSRGELRQLKFLQVAEKMFMEKGYEGTSVNEVVKEAGGSLNTLYRYYGNKLGLFEAVFKHKTNELFSPFLNCDYWQADIQNNLLNFGRALQRVALSPDGIAITRLVVGENNQEQSEIRRIFYQCGPQTAIQILSQYLKCEQEKGGIHIAYPELAASQFLEMIKGPFYYRSLFGEKVSEKEMEQALQQAVKLLLRGCLT